MNSHEIIELDDDDDDVVTVNSGGKANVINSTPLNLETLLRLSNSTSHPAKGREISGSNAFLAKRPRLVLGDFQVTSPPVPERSLNLARALASMHSSPINTSSISKSAAISTLTSSKHTFETDLSSFANSFETSLRHSVLRFKCTMHGCRRIVMGNIGIICHLWAHVAQSVGKLRHEGARSDNSAVTACPHCTVRFLSPYTCQTHIHKTHGRRGIAVRHTCYICESDLQDARTLQLHLEQNHADGDLPYRCPACSYKTSMRMRLFNHFVATHKNTTWLMCPFCSYSEQVHARNATLVTPNRFIRHLESHAKFTGVHKCDQCSYTFITSEEFRDHVETHKQRIKVQLVHVDPQCGREQSKLSFTEDSTQIMCSECRENNQYHNDQCLQCMEKKYLHQLKRRSGATLSAPGRVGVCRRHVAVHPDVFFICSCGIRTRDGQRILHHFEEFNHTFERVQDDMELPSPSDELDLEEADRFALVPRPSVPRSPVSVSTIKSWYRTPINEDVKIRGRRKRDIFESTRVSDAKQFVKRLNISFESTMDMWSSIQSELEKEPSSRDGTEEPEDLDDRSDEKKSESAQGSDFDEDDLLGSLGDDSDLITMQEEELLGY